MYNTFKHCVGTLFRTNYVLRLFKLLYKLHRREKNMGSK